MPTKLSLAQDYSHIQGLSWLCPACCRASRWCPVFVLLQQEHLRPRFPLGTPHDYQDLAERCWQADWEKRWVPTALYCSGACPSAAYSTQRRVHVSMATGWAPLAAALTKKI